MAKTRTVRFDVVKAEKVRKDLGLTKAQFGVKLGHCGSFWGLKLKEGRIGFSDILLFKSLYGVDIELKKLDKDFQVQNDVNKDFDWNKLEKVIMKAVYEGMIKALESDGKHNE